MENQVNTIYIKLLIESHITPLTIINEDMLDVEAIVKTIKLIGKKINNQNQGVYFIQIILKKITHLPNTIKIKILQVVFSILATIGINQAMIDEVPQDLNPQQFSKNYVIQNKEEINDPDDLTFNYPTTLSQDFINELKNSEGLPGTNGAPALTAYNLKDNRITVGWGHAKPHSTSQYKVGDKITSEVANQLFDEDIDYAKRGVDRMIQRWTEDGKKHYDIPQSVYEVMVSLAFNMGVSGLLHTTVAQYVKRGQYEAAANTILVTGTSPNNNNVTKGLKQRRVREKIWFEKDVKTTQQLKPKLNQKKFPY